MEDDYHKQYHARNLKKISDIILHKEFEYNIQM